MVKFETNRVDRIEETLYGTDDNAHCELVLEIFGLEDNIIRKYLELDGVLGPVNIDYGLPTEVRFEGGRVDYDDLKKWHDNMRLEMAFNNAGLRRPHDRGDAIDKLLDEAPMEYVQAEKDVQMYAKPYPNIDILHELSPRPKLVFEAHYHLGRNRELREVYKDVKEFIDEGLMPQIAEVEFIKDRDVILMIPLRSILDISELDTTQFKIGNFASEIADRMVGIDEDNPETYRLERIMLTCTEVHNG